MRYVSVAYAIASYGVFSGSGAVINAGVVRPVVAFKKSRVVPVIASGIGVFCIRAVVYNVIVENEIVARIL